MHQQFGLDIFHTDLPSGASVAETAAVVVVVAAGSGWLKVTVMGAGVSPAGLVSPSTTGMNRHNQRRAQV